MINLDRKKRVGDEMKALLQDGKAIIMKKIGILCFCLMSALLISAVIWGQDVYSLLQGTTAFEQYEPDIKQTNTKDKLKHSYIQADIEMITGSYAQHGTMKENEMQNKTVYYLMPIQNGEYFITVIANGEITANLDEMEKAFYNSIGSDDKTYPEKLSIKGGFKLLQDEEKELALDYFKNYDSKIKTINDLDKICSPYAIVINQINHITTESLWTLLWLWLLVFAIFVFTTALYFSGYLLTKLKKDIKKLSDRCLECLDDDYRLATPIENLKIGVYCLYKKEPLTMRVYDYDNFIWVYQKEVLAKKKGSYQVCAYDIQGKQHILWQGHQQKTAEKLAQRIFDHCHNALLGFESFIYEYWKENPQGLYDKLQELSLINKKIQKEKMQSQPQKKYFVHKQNDTEKEKRVKERTRKVRKLGR